MMEPSIESESLSDRSDATLKRIRDVTGHVFGQAPVGREIDQLCREHESARRAILTDRTSGATVVALVGATGQGKSWLLRQLIKSAPVADKIQSGNNSDQATEKLIWIGPSPPVDLDARTETYLACASTEMASIGIPYILVDSPGATDDRTKIAAVAKRALSMASVLVLVVRRDQLRSHAVSVLNQAAEGTLIVPVINAIRERDGETTTDIDAFVTRLRESAPTSQIAPAVLVDDFEVSGKSETTVGSAAIGELSNRLQTALNENWDGDRRKSTRLAALDMRFHAAMRSMLRDQLPGLADAVHLLHRETRQIPAEVAETLLGGGSSLRGAIRSRLRLGLMEDTPAMFFPFRSLLGVLNLTAGAWDRLLLSLSGSLPSLIGTVYAGARNLATGREAASEMREGLVRRSSAAVDERLRPLARDFQVELNKLQEDSDDGLPSDPLTRESSVASLSGLDTLQERSMQIFDNATSAAMMNRATVWLWGLVGTLVFWALLAGPIVALYRDYLAASYSVLGSDGHFDSFPHPSAGMLITSVLLSLLPTALVAMIVVTIAQSRGRVGRVEARLRDDHHQAIGQLQKDGILRLRWDDPVLADAEFLLSIGRVEA